MNRRIGMVFMMMLIVAGVPVLADWHFQLVDSVGETGRSSCIMLDSSENPAISYYKTDTKDLKYAVKNGSSWNLYTIEVSGDVGFFSSFEFDSQDEPHISYTDFDTKDLKYAYYESNDWHIETLVDSPPNVSYNTKLMLDPANYPYVVYEEYMADSRAYQLKCRYNSAGGWYTRTLAVYPDAFDVCMDLSHYIYIAFVNTTTQSIVLGINNTTGTTNFTSIDTSGDTKGGVSLERDENYGIHVCYANIDTMDLCYAYDDGTGFSKDVVDHDAYVSGRTEMVLDSLNHPHILYNDVISSEMRYAWYDGTTWYILKIPAPNDSFLYYSLTMDSNDLPHISLYDEVAKDLYYCYWLDPTPTPTQVPTSTPTGPPQPTPTPTPPGTCTDLGCTIEMPSNDFGPGDPCSCRVLICNPENVTHANIPVFVILDVYGMYFFAPDFDDFAYFEEDISPGITSLQILPQFAWPEGAGFADGIKWYAGMTDSSMTVLFGALDTFEFGWHE